MQVDFIGIGTARSNTTWLYNCLKEHPEIFMPQKKDEDSMFYLTVDLLIKAVNDANNRDLGGVEHLRKAISIAESLDPEKEALFVLQDKDDIQLFHFKSDEENPSLLQM